MRSTSRGAIVLTALAVGVFQVAGSFGAANNQPDRKGIDVLAVVLLLVGPAALAVRDRWPLDSDRRVDRRRLRLRRARLSVRARSSSASSSPSTTGCSCVGRATWILAGVGYVAFFVAEAIDPRAANGLGLAAPRARRRMVAARAHRVRGRAGARASSAPSSSASPRKRASGQASEQRLQLAQELHDVLAHNISLINVQASVALHLLDEQPEQARTALADDQGRRASDALGELRSALDVLRNAATRRRSRRRLRLARPRRARRRRPRRRSRRARSSDGAAARRCPRRSSSPRSGSCRRRSPTSPGTRARRRVDGARWPTATTLARRGDATTATGGSRRRHRQRHRRHARAGGRARRHARGRAPRRRRLPRSRPACPVAAAVIRSCSPTTRRWCGPASARCSTPQHDIDVVGEAADGDEAVRAGRRATGPTSCSWTSACPASTGSRPPAASSTTSASTACTSSSSRPSTSTSTSSRRSAPAPAGSS